MVKAHGLGVRAEGAELEPFDFEHRDLRPHDVLIDIHYCGVCHSDIHQARNEWGGSISQVTSRNKGIRGATRPR